MSASELDRRIDVQRRSQSQSASGAMSDEWSTITNGNRLASGYKPLRGDERSSAPQWVAREQVQFKVRWRADLAKLSPLNRIIYPAIMPDVSPEDQVTGDRVFDIMEVHEVERRAWLVIRAARRADGSEA